MICENLLKNFNYQFKDDTFPCKTLKIKFSERFMKRICVYECQLIEKF